MGHCIKLIAFSILVLFSFSLVFALGVSSPYWNTNPLKMYPGETRNVDFPLVNGVNDPATEATVILTAGEEFMEITSGESYSIGSGENEEKIKLKIKVPSNAEVGSTYDLGFIVRYSPEGEGANVKLDVEYNIDFPLQVVNQGEEEFIPAPVNEEINFTLLIVALVIIMILAILIIIAVIFRRRPNQFVQLNQANASI